MKKLLIVLCTILIFLSSCSSSNSQEEEEVVVKEEENEVLGYYTTQYLRGVGNTTIDNLSNKKIGLPEAYGSEYNEYIKEALTEYGVSENNYVYFYSYENIPGLIDDNSIDAFVVNSKNEDLISDYRVDYEKDDYKILKEFEIPYYEEIVREDDASQDWSFFNTTTFLITGIDERVDPDTTSGVRTDVLMAMMVDPIHNHILTIHFPRDSYVKSHNYGYYDKVNALIQNGIEDLRDSLQDLLGTGLHCYVQVSFSSFIDMINLIGGVRVDVPYNMTLDQDSYRNVANHISIDKGESLLYGEYALALARNRKYSGLVGGDFGRIRNQALIVNSIIDKIAKYPDLLDWVNILYAYPYLVYTDIPSFKMNTFVQLGQKIVEEGYTIDNYFIECYDGNVGGSYVAYIYDSSLEIAKGKAQLVTKGSIDKDNPYYEQIMTGYRSRGAGSSADGGYIGDEYDLREIYK